MKIKFFGKGVVKSHITGQIFFRFTDGEYILNTEDYPEKIVNKLKKIFKYEEIKTRKKRSKKNGS